MREGDSFVVCIDNGISAFRSSRLGRTSYLSSMRSSMVPLAGSDDGSADETLNENDEQE